MAPTEFLAIQHYQRIMGWLEVLEDHERPRVALLTGSTPTAKARLIRNVSASFLKCSGVLAKALCYLQIAKKSWGGRL